MSVLSCKMSGSVPAQGNARDVSGELPTLLCLMHLHQQHARGAHAPPMQLRDALKSDR